MKTENFKLRLRYSGAHLLNALAMFCFLIANLCYAINALFLNMEEVEQTAARVIKNPLDKAQNV